PAEQPGVELARLPGVGRDLLVPDELPDRRCGCRHVRSTSFAGYASRDARRPGNSSVASLADRRRCPHAAPVAAFELAREFMLRNARLLELRLFATLFEDAPPDGVALALGAYRNDDGGLGHGLEPDARCPESQPLFVAFGLGTLVEAGARDDELVLGCCD